MYRLPLIQTQWDCPDWGGGGGGQGVVLINVWYYSNINLVQQKLSVFERCPYFRYIALILSLLYCVTDTHRDTVSLHSKHAPRQHTDVLNSYRATVKDARKLVTNIFLDKTRLDSSRIHGWRPVKPRLPAQSVNRCSIQVRVYT